MREAHQKHVGDNVREGQGNEGQDREENAKDFADDVLCSSCLPDAQADHVVAEESTQDLMAEGCAGLGSCHGDWVLGGSSIVKQICLQVMSLSGAPNPAPCCSKR